MQTQTMTPGPAALLDDLKTPGNASVARHRPNSTTAPTANRSACSPKTTGPSGSTTATVVIHNAVPPENIDRMAALLWEFEEKDPADPATWYTPPRREIR